MKKNKSLIVTLSIIIGVVAFFALSFMIPNNSGGQQGNYELSTKDATVDEWLEDTKNDQYIVTVIGSTSCPHCQKYKPVISKLSNKYNFKAYFFEGDTLEEEEYDKLVGAYEEFDFEYIPFTAITKNGKVIITQTGFESEKNIKEFLEEYSVIKN